MVRVSVVVSAPIGDSPVTWMVAKRFWSGIGDAAAIVTASLAGLAVRVMLFPACKVRVSVSPSATMGDCASTWMVAKRFWSALGLAAAIVTLSLAGLAVRVTFAAAERVSVSVVVSAEMGLWAST